MTGASTGQPVAVGWWLRAMIGPLVCALAVYQHWHYWPLAVGGVVLGAVTVFLRWWKPCRGRHTQSDSASSEQR